MDIVKKPLISVVMPVFNGANFLSQAIESILKQTNSNFEFIIIDDGSTDNSAQIIQQFQKSDERIVFISRENQGLSKSLNEGIDLASGVWIARMDADDISTLDRFEKQLAWLEQTGADICGSWIECFGDVSSIIYRHPETDSGIKMGLLFGSLLAHPTVIVKASIIKEIRYDDSWNKAEDYELWTRMALRGVKMTNFPQVLLRYRVHSSQISSASNREQKLLTQAIRRGYWQSSSLVQGINKDFTEEFLKIFELNLELIDMNKVDKCMMQLIFHAKGESLVVIKKYGEYSYLKACTVDRSAYKRWKKICKISGLSFSAQMQILMIIACFFKFTNRKIILRCGKFLYSIFN